MREGTILTKWFNSQVFVTEFSIVLGLVLFVFLWALTVKIYQYKRAALINSIGFALAFLIATVIPWGTSRLIYREGLVFFINPISVLAQSILRASTHIPKFKIGFAYQGIFFIIGTQILGALVGYIFFSGLFYMLKSTKKYEALNNASVMDLIKLHEPLPIWKNAIKEVFFIGLFVSTITWLPFANAAQFATNPFWVVLFSTIIAFAIIFMSAPFNGFAFHLAFPFVYVIDVLVEMIKDHIKAQKNKEVLDIQVCNQHRYKIIYATTNLSITTAITIIFSLVIPIFMVLIGHHNKVSHNL